ncbi:MAG: glycosyltransferase family 4 protein [Nitrospirota bacterium]
MKRIKIVFIHYGGALGGAPISLASLAGGLDRNRYEPVVILTDHGPAMEFFKRTNVPCRIEPMRSGLFLGASTKIGIRSLSRFVFNYQKTLDVMHRVIETEKPDIVHLNTSVLLPHARIVNSFSIPLIWHVREMLQDGILGRMLVNEINKRASYVITTTNTVRDIFPDKRNVITIYNAVDLNYFHPLIARQNGSRIRNELGINKNRFVVAIVGHVTRAKGHYVFLEAAHHAVKINPNILFMVIGGGDLPAHYTRSWKGHIKRMINMPMNNDEDLQQKVHKYGLDKHFMFLPFRYDMPEMLGAVDLIVFPSVKAEGFGRPLMEAMATARPVVATAIGPTAELLQDGNTGWLVPPDDPHALSEAICNCTERSEEELALIGQKQRKRAEEIFDLNKQVVCIQQLYDDVLS